MNTAAFLFPLFLAGCVPRLHSEEALPRIGSMHPRFEMEGSIQKVITIRNVFKFPVRVEYQCRDFDSIDLSMGPFQLVELDNGQEYRFMILVPATEAHSNVCQITNLERIEKV